MMDKSDTTYKEKYYVLQEDGCSFGGGQSNGPMSRMVEYTVEDAVESMGFGWFQMKIFLICGLFAASDAMEMLLLSVLSPELRCEWLLPEWKVALFTMVRQWDRIIVNTCILYKFLNFSN